MLLELISVGAIFGLVAMVDPLGPGVGPWEVDSPENHGLKTASFDIAFDYINRNANPIHHLGCLVVIKDGALVYEKYRTSSFNQTGHLGWSMTKTLGALVVGWATTHSNLDIDADITATYGVESPRPYPVTSRQIMSQAIAGEHGPGEAWKYDSSGTEWVNHLARVVPAATSRKPSQIWEDEFKQPLGLTKPFDWPIADWDWAAGSVGTCREYARVGQLMLNRGRWKGVNGSIVSADYIGQMSSVQTRYAPYTQDVNPCYGLLTWLPTDPQESSNFTAKCKPNEERKRLPKDSYFALGAFGQAIMVLPSNNAVVVGMGLEIPDKGLVEVEIYDGFCKGKVFEDWNCNQTLV